MTPRPFSALSAEFEQFFAHRHFPAEPAGLYDAADYLPALGGKRVRPVLCLMANELFNDLNEHAWAVAAAIEMFHNFTLVHDDIMDEAPLRRSHTTTHIRFGIPTALLAGDVMLVKCYQYLQDLPPALLNKVMRLFNQTAAEVCEGQQLDMDMEKQSAPVNMDDYIHMIGLKTSVLLAAALQMGAVLGGAGLGNQHHLYAFGKNLGIAFQVQDDYLDAFGDPEKFGKQPGGDIIAGKKTFLTIHLLEKASAAQKKQYAHLMQPGTDPQQRVAGVLQLFRDCGADAQTRQLKESFYQTALQHLEAVAVISSRKNPLEELAQYLLGRDH